MFAFFRSLVKNALALGTRGLFRIPRIAPSLDLAADLALGFLARIPEVLAYFFGESPEVADRSQLVFAALQPFHAFAYDVGAVGKA